MLERSRGRLRPSSSEVEAVDQRPKARAAMPTQFQASGFFERRPRRTASPPISIVRAAIAEPGSISGAEAGDDPWSCPTGVQTSNENHKNWSILQESFADATPERAASNTVIPIFLSTENFSTLTSRW